MTPFKQAILVIAVMFCGLVWFIWGLLPRWTDPTDITGIERIEKMETGGPIPFSLSDLQGKEFHFAGISDKVLVIHFWATWCAPCLEEFPSIVRLAAKAGSGVVFLAVSSDESLDDIQNFLKSFGTLTSNIIVLRDPTNKIAQQYGTIKLPESYIFDKRQKLVRKVPNSLKWDNPDVFGYLKDLWSM